MKSYDTFWEELSPSYPVSKGELRLPVATSIQQLDEVNLPKVLESLGHLLEHMLSEFGTEEQAVARAIRAGEGRIIPLITDEYSGVVRFDCVLDQYNNVRILELNADYPDGLLLHDHTYSVLSGSLTTLHADAYLGYFSPESFVHVAHHDEAFFVDAYHLEKVTLDSAGIRASIGGIHGKRERPILRRCLEVSKLSDEDIEAIGLMNPSRILNTFALRTLGYKSLLSKLEHPYLPKTLLVSAETRDELRDDPSRWVLKPSEGCEGHGIYFGNNVSEDAWVRLVDSVIGKGYVAQEFVTIKKRNVELYDDGGVVEKELYFDFCPHFFIDHGKVRDVGHVLMRFSENRVVNVSQGGGIGYHQR